MIVVSFYGLSMQNGEGEREAGKECGEGETEEQAEREVKSEKELGGRVREKELLLLVTISQALKLCSCVEYSRRLLK